MTDGSALPHNRASAWGVSEVQLQGVDSLEHFTS
jgi:hypothetical protein